MSYIPSVPDSRSQDCHAWILPNRMDKQQDWEQAWTGLSRREAVVWILGWFQKQVWLLQPPIARVLRTSAMRSRWSQPFKESLCPCVGGWISSVTFIYMSSLNRPGSSSAHEACLLQPTANTSQQSRICPFPLYSHSAQNHTLYLLHSAVQKVSFNKLFRFQPFPKVLPPPIDVPSLCWSQIQLIIVRIPYLKWYFKWFSSYIKPNIHTSFVD